ncbi:MAG: hypothetical protein ACLPY1_18015 [Terracidiphilus sp.]
MAIESIVALIDEEIAKLTQIRTLLATTTGSATYKIAERKAKKAPAAAKAKKRRVLSPEARKRIADAQRKRWAAQKAKAK